MKALSLALPLALALAAAPSAQLCLGPDQLDQAPCCTPVDLALPNLPPISLPSKGICWDTCAPVQTTCNLVEVGVPVGGPQCGEFLADVNVLDCNGQALLKGSAVLNYTRTWAEGNQAGTAKYQVYRFALKVDLFGAQSSPPVCPVPDCIPAVQATFFYGYVDYAFDCASGAVEHALALFHGCDELTHDPLLSAQPGVYHPTRSYAIVGPDTSANPFNPSFTSPLAGPVVAEAMRSTNSPIPFACLAEEPVLQGQLDHLISVCLCPLQIQPGQMHLSSFSGLGACGSSFNTINAWPNTPWYELVTIGLGRWSNATGGYPGPEQLAVSEGLFLYRDACASSGAVQQSLDVFYGVETQFGFQVVPTSAVAPATQNFLDLASNYSTPLPGPIAFPLLGSANSGTRHLIYVNVP